MDPLSPLMQHTDDGGDDDGDDNITKRNHDEAAAKWRHRWF